MPNALYYYMIAAVGIALIIYTACRKQHLKDLLSFFLFVAGVAYLSEVFILFVFDSYAYKPELFADPVAENIFGHLLCNGLFWGGFTLFFVAFSLGNGWMLFISLLFTLTEVFFLKMGLYEHHWWRLYMTSASVIVFLFVMRKWYSALMQKRFKWLRYTTFFFISWLLTLGPSMVLLLCGFQNARLRLDANMYLDHIYFVVPYHLVLAGINVFFVNVLRKRIWKGVPFLIIFVCDVLLVHYKIMQLHGDWNLFYLTLLRGLCLAGYILVEKHSLKLSGKL